MVGDACGGFVTMDEETKEPRHRKEARVLVKNNGKEVPGKLEVIAGFASFSIPLWWEDSVWFSVTEIKPQRGVEPVSKVPIEQEEGECVSRTVVRVEKEIYGKGTPVAGIGDGVNGLELRFPKEKARFLDGESLVSLQKKVGLVKKISNATESGGSGLISLEGRKRSGNGRFSVDRQRNQSSVRVGSECRKSMGGLLSL